MKVHSDEYVDAETWSKSAAARYGAATIVATVGGGDFRRPRRTTVFSLHTGRFCAALAGWNVGGTRRKIWWHCPRCGAGATNLKLTKCSKQGPRAAPRQDCSCRLQRCSGPGWSRLLQTAQIAL